MGDNNITENKRIYISAYDDYQYHKYQSAIDKLKTIDLDHSNLKINHLIVKSLFHLKKYRQAEKNLLEMPDSYTNSVDDFNFMILVLLKNASFIKAREITVSVNIETLKRDNLKQIVDYENNYSKKHSSTINELVKSFCSIVNQKLPFQKNELEKALKLPLHQFVFACKYLLTNPFLNPIMRISIFDILRKIDLNEQIEFLWIDHQRHLINPSNLKPLFETKSYLQLSKIVDSHYGHDDPMMTFRLNNLFNMQLLILYPYNDRKINSAKLWFKITDSLFNDQQFNFKTKLEVEIWRQQKKLDQIINKLTR
ncbi:hypothetical protein [Philodulcilactobacillus myokoensis]|uniref:hypothetical protein n=1 Tax=Philodulcilactobacillus myokoensis TaxID=2929573 RepID=UPI002570CC9A|nr:hypothetical protein [Philodulcilactobacillus myokoensis]